MSECSECYQSIVDIQITLLSVIKYYKIPMNKDVRKLLCSYLINPCKCPCKPNCYTCINCFFGSEPINEPINGSRYRKRNGPRNNPNICNSCEEHCCQLCYVYSHSLIAEHLFCCKRCDKWVCIDCVGICWCQSLDCICKNCTTKDDIPDCSKCDNKYKIPICEDASIYCDNCDEDTYAKEIMFYFYL